MKILKKLFIIFILLGIFAGCSEDVLVENPPHIIAADNLFVNLAGFEAGLNGLYAQFRRERGGWIYTQGNNIMINPAISGTDNMYGNHFTENWERICNNWGIENSADELHYKRFWDWIYETINTANTIINRAENPDINWSDKNKNRVIGEARLIRAWAYRHATFMWGDVPYTGEESGFVINTDWVRTPVAEVRMKMEQDLLFAEMYLPETSNNPGKVVKGVATHYLAELYLTIGDPTSAKEKAKSLIDDGPFSLITARYGVKSSQPGTPFSDMFLDGNSNKAEGNTEALWVMQHEIETVGGGDNIMRRWHRNQSQSVKVDGVTGAIDFSVENGGRGRGCIGPTRYAAELYEPQDDRGGVYAWRTFEVLNDPTTIPPGWTLGDTIWHDWKGKDETVNNPYWPSTRKWDWANPAELAGARQYNDQVYLRLAETYILLAEALLALDDAEGAATTLNIIRQRSNASPISADDVTVEFILDERSRELYSEEHRRYTLLRYGKWFERTQLYNKIAGPNIRERDKLFPIPQDVIDANLTTELKQNPGY